jgi:hypothetical protein
VSDGLSNTLLLGERKYQSFISPTWPTAPVNCGAANVFAIQWDNIFSNSRRNPVYGNNCVLGESEGFINDVQTGNVVPPGPGNNNNPICGRGAASFHVGGAHFALGDGSVRFISQNIQWIPDVTVNSTFEYLGGIADGNPVGDF